MEGLPDDVDLRVVLNSIAEGVTLTDADGTILFSNAAAVEILGVEATVLRPEEWAEHYGTFRPDGETPFPTDEYPLLRALRNEPTDGVEMLIRNPNRPEGALISVSGRPLRGAGSEILGAVVVFRDITKLTRATAELRAANEALRESRRLKEELLAFVLHDLKSPLTGILALSELLQESELPSEEDREIVAELRDAAEALQRMVMNLLDVQLAEEGALRPAFHETGVAALVEEAYRTMRPRVRLAGKELVEPEGVPGTLTLLADATLVLRVFQNLVDNCIKYGPRGGRIWLEARPGEGRVVVFRVRDEGPGVPRELRERIFDKYALAERSGERRNADSRGIGLRFCRVVAEAHRGRIWVEDNEPTGACFCLEMPTV